ncbi:FepA family TonB-dependent siderophore receptor [Mangrovicoccus algicola]|uniref:FepA family TonB-dependent siderophore receptor n=1 Tax=Mangrovicoccus algicola TaxID=2771008 RepID=A0A8J6YTB3_9RHOB|nr:FepA family TonB-dependent siderophore receptor [Mangrovicoccus algicola]MBE3637255.1 FepA family TonB-dependent siderophore receptor [Mangrovicoccus algicola]
MTRLPGLRLRGAASLLTAAALSGTAALAQTATTSEAITLENIVISAQQETLQNLGVSEITAEQIEKTPVSNDISELVRKQPGVNLTGASSSGQRGNQRQIDIRGMGPENTLILIDGVPVQSRNVVQMRRGGERDTRGDSNWVPAELIERIEVIRGPAAARYGSGAAGGVVNIITKRPETETFSVNLRYDQPESDMEGATKRVNVMWAKPLSDKLSFRVTANYNRTEPDDPDINDAATSGCTSTGDDCDSAAGSEGVINRDATFLLSWEPVGGQEYDFEFGISEQDNIYAGDTLLSNSTDTTTALADDEETTNKMLRRTFKLTHRGEYDFGDTMSYFQWEHTRDKRLSEGSAGGGEGAINSESEWGIRVMNNITAKTEWTMPMSLAGRDASTTVGAEIRHERMDDPVSIATNEISVDFGDYPQTAAERDRHLQQTMAGLYVESNILATDRLTVIPALRYDWADTFGHAVSGGLNASYALSGSWTLKGGAAQAFKAPNIYQLNEGYAYVTSGNGCPYPYHRNGPCYVLGNEDLDAETSLNTELGIAYNGLGGLNATLTGFYNYYHDKIQSGTNQIGTVTSGSRTYRLYQWENVPEAEVGGVEGSVAAPLSDVLDFSANFTWMAVSENKESGEPLSLVPDYTINAQLNWQATDKLSMIPAVTYYGPIQAAETSELTGYDNDETDSRKAYGLVNLGFYYDYSQKIRVSAGVTNLFDKTVLRSNEGANTYNEPGRAYYVGLSSTF